MRKRDHLVRGQQFDARRKPDHVRARIAESQLLILDAELQVIPRGFGNGNRAGLDQKADFLANRHHERAAASLRYPFERRLEHVLVLELGSLLERKIDLLALTRIDTCDWRRNQEALTELVFTEVFELADEQHRAFAVVFDVEGDALIRFVEDDGWIFQGKGGCVGLQAACGEKRCQECFDTGRTKKNMREHE